MRRTTGHGHTNVFGLVAAFDPDPTLFVELHDHFFGALPVVAGHSRIAGLDRFCCVVWHIAGIAYIFLHLRLQTITGFFGLAAIEGRGLPALAPLRLCDIAGLVLRGVLHADGVGLA